MSALTINNEIELVIPDKDWIESILQAIIHDLDLKGEIVVSLQVDENSDGTAHYPNGVTLVLAPMEEYPCEWSVDSENGQGHINNMVILNNDYETFVFLAAHELRHIWQWQHWEKTMQICTLLKCNDETEADIYAIRMLSAYREKSE